MALRYIGEVYIFNTRTLLDPSLPFNLLSISISLREDP
jgi:hypothetical protein